MGNNSCNCLNKIKLNLDFGKDSEIFFENIESNESFLNQKGYYSNRSNTNFTKKKYRTFIFSKYTCFYQF